MKDAEYVDVASTNGWAAYYTGWSTL